MTLDLSQVNGTDGRQGRRRLRARDPPNVDEKALRLWTLKPRRARTPMTIWISGASLLSQTIQATELSR